MLVAASSVTVGAYSAPLGQEPARSATSVRDAAPCQIRRSVDTELARRGVGFAREILS